MSRKLLQYKNNELCFGNQLKPLLPFVKNYTQPVMVYDLSVIKDRIEWIQKWPRLGKLHFAIKANFHLEVLKLIKSMGCGTDVVSLGEVKRSLEAGFTMQDIIFSGVGKSREELTWAIERDIYQINVESISELRKITEIAKLLQKKVSVGLRINPEVDAETHKSISTALKDSKFGLDFETGRECVRMIGQSELVQLKALSFHLGSQIMNVSVYEKALQVMKPYFTEARTICPELERFDLGGGLGIDYKDADSDIDQARWQSLQDLFETELKGFQATYLLEIGRFLVARSGVLLCRVEIIKKTPAKKFIILDAGMTHIMRPALYDAYHHMLPLKLNPGSAETVDIVGPICESTDVLGEDRQITPMNEEEFMAICDTGAYGSVMASDYNLRDRALEVFI
ncbi:MAG: diaminopimelate decarboxylase [Bdellovibrionaceae bacterium]|nr:diaminopimelate decarboxylase [Pseudobdellovibrionaceae bacterium]